MEYQKKFVEEKGHYTAVADDPETERAKRAAKQASQLQYTAQSREAAQSRPAAQSGPVEGTHLLIMFWNVYREPWKN